MKKIQDTFTPEKINLKGFLGRTFLASFPVVGNSLVYRSINGITKSAPVRLASANHGVPDGWQVKISDVKGMKEINSSQFVAVKAVSKDVLEINSINSTSFADYQAGGTIEYQQPVSLVDSKAVFKIYNRDQTVLEKLVTCNLTTNAVDIVVRPEEIEELGRGSFSYSLDLVKDQLILPIAVGSLTLSRN